MYKIATLNKISNKGLCMLNEGYELIEDVNQSDAIIVRSADMHNMDFGDNLLAIARAGAGVNNIPIEKCSEAGIVVFNAPGANANAVKELVLTSILMAARNVNRAIEWMKTVEKNVPKVVEKNKSKFAGEEIKGKTLGVVGLGAIGVLVANSAENLGMKVIGYDPFISVKNAHNLSPNVEIYDNLELVLPYCDYITIHVPATEDTMGMFNKETIEMMKKKVVLINFARDKVVNSSDVIEALKTDQLRYYVTDFPTDDLIGINDVICIPHLGASTRESEDNCARMAVEEVTDYLENGNITNSVNFPNCELGRPSTETRINILNKNIPAMLGTITGVFADLELNISDLINRSAGDYACTIIDVDGEVDKNKLLEALSFEGIIRVRFIHNPL